MGEGKVFVSLNPRIKLLELHKCFCEMNCEMCSLLNTVLTCLIKLRVFQFHLELIYFVSLFRSLQPEILVANSIFLQ